jgi:hypothetical protein
MLLASSARSMSTVSDRRASPRLQVSAYLVGEVPNRSLRITALRDLAFNGFSVESPMPVTVGSRYEFRFVTDGGLAIRVRAEVVYSRVISGDIEGAFAHGFRFLLDTPQAEAAVDLLVEAATSPISFV